MHKIDKKAQPKTDKTTPHPLSHWVTKLQAPLYPETKRQRTRREREKNRERTKEQGRERKETR